MRTVRFIFSNLTTFILALLLAVVIWATAVRANDPDDTRTYEIDVETRGKPADATLVSTPPSSVLITIQGPTSALEGISPADFTGVIDLSDVPYGESEVLIDIQGIPEDITLVSQFPETAKIQLEQIITRDIPVKEEVRGEVARGHLIGDVRVEPETIQVTGPAPRVNELSESRVTVFLDNAREDTSEFRRPTFYDTDGNVASVVGLTVNPEEVEVIIPVIELAGFAEKPVAVQFVGEPASGYRLLDIAVEPNSVQVTGSPALIDGLRVETEPVDITGLSESQTLQVGLDLPDGVSMVEVQPIVVTVQIEPLLSSDVVRRPVEIRALGEGLTATVEPETVRVIIFGPIPVLNSLEQDDVRVTVDLLNLEAGTHLLAPFVAISVDSVEHRSTQPPVVTVIITNILSITNGLTDTESLTATAPLLDSSSPTSGSSSSSAFDLSASVVDAGLPSGVAWVSRRFS